MLALAAGFEGLGDFAQALIGIAQAFTDPAIAQDILGAMQAAFQTCGDAGEAFEQLADVGLQQLPTLADAIIPGRCDHRQQCLQFGRRRGGIGCWRKGRSGWIVRGFDNLLGQGTDGNQCQTGTIEQGLGEDKPDNTQRDP